MNGTITTHDDDAGDGWQIPDPALNVDRAHAARVKVLQAGFAREILAIPSDVTPRSRAIRIGQAKNRVSRFYGWTCEKYVHGAGASVRITDTRLINLWITAYCEAVNAVMAALDAGEPLRGFLWADEAADVA